MAKRPAILQQLIDVAQQSAKNAKNQAHSGHLLLALLDLDTPVKSLLHERGLVRDKVEKIITQSSGNAESPNIWDQIDERCQRVIPATDKSMASAHHVLMVLCTTKESLAYRILVAQGIDPATLSAICLALATGGRGRQNKKTTTQFQQLPLSVGASANVAPTARRIKTTTSRKDPRVTLGTGTATNKGITKTQFEIDPKKFPTLSAFGRNLSAQAAALQIDPIVGRKEIINQVLDILGKRRANNPCLVGEPGVGKTTLVEGLAYMQAHDSDAVPWMKQRTLIALNVGALLTGTQLRGAFSERIAKLRAEVESADGRIVIFLDDIHTLVGAGSAGDGAVDAVGELGTAMSQGRFPCIGATTPDNYKRYIEESPALQRRLQLVIVPEPSPEETQQILNGILPSYARHHGVTYQHDACDAAIRLSSRYLSERYLPDKAISLLDLAGSRAQRRKDASVARPQIAELVAEMTQIPIERLLTTDADRLLDMEHFLSQHLVGHPDNSRRLCEVIRRNYAGFSSHRPIGSFLFMGPTGVGKTETVKVLADFLFQSRDAVCRFDMSEFMESHSVSRLIGAPPGYVGYENGGQLTESMRRRPYQIVLFDEIEKAHRDVWQLLLQVLDDGRLTDGRGRTVDFSNAVIIMTSNLGSHHYQRQTAPVGFATRENGHEQLRDAVLATAKQSMPIELWNRIEERLVFDPLSRDHVLQIAELLLAESSRRLYKERGIRYRVSPQVIEYLIENGGFDPLLGARPMRSTIQRIVETSIATAILKKQISDDSHAWVERDGDQLKISSIANSDASSDSASA